MFKSIWKILGFFTVFSAGNGAEETQAEIQIKTQAEVQAETQVEVQAETHTLINLIKDGNFLEFKKRLSSASDGELLNTFKYINDNSSINFRYILSISDVLRREEKQALLNEIYNYSSNSSNIFLKEAIETVRQDVECENNALKCLQEPHHKGKMAHDDSEKILTPIAKARKNGDANKRFPNLMAFIKDNESAKESLDNIYWKQKASEQFLYALKNADEGRQKEFLIEFLTGKVEYSEYQRSVITEGIKSSSELQEMFEKATKYVEKDLSFLQKLQGLNNKMTMASSQSEKEEITKEFLQIKEEILEEKAQLPSTWQYISNNGDDPFCKELQTEKKNRDTDYNALKSLEDYLQGGKSLSKLEKILTPVAQDALLNNGNTYIKTIERIKRTGENGVVLQAYNNIIADEDYLNSLQKLKSPKSDNAEDILEKETQSKKENRNLDRNVLTLLKRLKRDNGATDAQSISILESVANDELSNGSCAIFIENKKFISENNSLRQAFDAIKKDLNLLQIVKSLDSNNAGDIQKFEQIKAELLEKQAQLPRTWKYVRENGSNYFCKGLQTEKENRDTDRDALASLKRLERDHDAKNMSILESVANDELSNNGSCATFIKTKEFISKDDLLLQAFDAIKKDLNLLQIVKSLDSNNAQDIQKFEQMIEEILEQEAQLSKTFEYLSKDGGSLFWSILQSKKQNRDTDLKSLERLRCNNTATHPQSIIILEFVANDELSNGSCAIFIKTKEFISKDDLLLQAFDAIKKDLNLLQIVKSLDSNNAEDIQKFEQIKEEILEEKAQLPRTWQYITKNRNNPLCGILQTERENRERDDSTLKSLKDYLQGDKKLSTLEKILTPVAQANVLGIGNIYKKTILFINGDHYLRQVFNIINDDMKAEAATSLTDPATLNVKENSLAQG